VKFFILFLSVFLFADVSIKIKTKTVDMDYESTLFVTSKSYTKTFKARLFHKIIENNKYYIIQGDYGYSSYLLLINKKTAKTSTLPLGGFQQVKIKNNNLYFSNVYNNLFMSCSACSPWVDMVVKVENDKFVLLPKLMKNENKPLIIHPFIDNYGFLNFKEEKFYPTINTILYYLYIGENKKAAKIIKKYIKFQNKAQISIFVEDLLAAMKKSYFWHNILDNNHYFHYECDKRGCKKIYFDITDVKMDLFEKIKGK